MCSIVVGRIFSVESFCGVLCDRIILCVSMCSWSIVLILVVMFCKSIGLFVVIMWVMLLGLWFCMVVVSSVFVLCVLRCGVRLGLDRICVNGLVWVIWFLFISIMVVVSCSILGMEWLIYRIGSCIWLCSCFSYGMILVLWLLFRVVSGLFMISSVGFDSNVCLMVMCWCLFFDSVLGWWFSNCLSFSRLIMCLKFCVVFLC